LSEPIRLHTCFLTMLKLFSTLLGCTVLAGVLLGAEVPQGLALTVTTGATTDRWVAENVWLFVPAGESASPFVGVGRFEAKWEGFISSELRADYAFHAEFQGDLKVVIGDAIALEGAGTGVTPLNGKSVRLNKGPNPMTVTYTAPAGGDAFVRLFWSNPETPYNPVPPSALTHTVTEPLLKSLQAHEGRHLLTELRCAKCHTTPGTMAELAMDAPSFQGIGSRRRFDWLSRWIQNPEAMRPGTPMPTFFHGAEAAGQADAIAAFLVSLKGTAKAEVAAGDAAEGKSLYEKLHCAACHNAPDASETDPKKISQKQVLAKFVPGSLAAFLQKPEEHYAWIRMPNFKLSASEAAHLAAYLESTADKPGERTAPNDAGLVDRGRKLVSSTGCLNCHALDGSKNDLVAKPLATLPAERWTSGCLANKPAADSKSPWYSLSDNQKASLRTFAATDRSSLNRQVDADFLQRQSTALNCRECHGKFEGFPTWELLGGKLKPEWAGPFIAGNESRKPRPWLESRMPAFPAFAQRIAVGLATGYGLPPKTPADGSPDADAAEKGRKLASASGGFSCVSCHGAADFGATQVFEAPGINLALSYERLQRSYFNRWLRSPLSVDPTTKMPVYFDELGKSPLTEIYEGDGPKTINSVWEYIRLKDKMPRPE